MNVAVIAHRKKSIGGGLAELRTALHAAGIADPQWHEIKASSQAPKKVEKSLRRGADLIIAWGGDGTVQRCVDALSKAGVGENVALAIVPTGTANLLAQNLGIPQDLHAAVEIALHGRRRPLDVGLSNGEYFAVMAGIGFDALMIREANQKLKESLGSAAYIWSGMKNLRNHSTRTRIKLDGKRWFAGRASCVLLGNVSAALGGVKVFPAGSPDDGLLEIGVVQANSSWEWVKVLARVVAGTAERSPLVATARGRRISIKLGRRMPYQIDGGSRDPIDHLKVRIKAQALSVCVPAESEPGP